MRKATQVFIETALRSDDTCDNACIGPAIDAAKGKRGQHFSLDELDRVMSRKDVAERLNVSAKGVQRAIKQLSALGYIAVLSGKARGLPNRYCLAESIAPDSGEVVNKDMKSVNMVGRSDRGGRTNEVGQSGRSGETTTPPRSDTLTEVNENLKGEKTKVEVSKSVATNTPTMSQAIRAAYAHGASMEEAKRFWRFNQLRDWKALAKMPLDFLAEEWVDKWIKKNPRDFEAEHSRRRLEAKRREEA